MTAPSRLARILVLVAAPALAAPALVGAPLAAQDPTTRDSAAFPRGTWSFGGSLGLPWSPGDFELEAGFRVD